ncbi:aldehyde dehydrogenase family protein, partial [Bacillus thuringiensis]|nr:aldehyde dehydrogenase family protein [Bacillus thuringiensis]MRB96237.1 aldehyde dehydrogenase family protein [Bacillus thuringiensis]
MMVVNVYNFYVNGEWRESSSGETIEISSPYLHEVIGQVQAITRGEVDEAIASAKEA